MLYIVPTPVGNLEDMTFRAIRVLKEVDLILAEDTRTSAVLLQHYDIHTPLKSHHKFNEHETSADIVNRLLAGANIALISDAGTPAISDPGFFLTRAAAEAGIEIQCLPGATAFVPALVDSGLPNIEEMPYIAVSLAKDFISLMLQSLHFQLILRFLSWLFFLILHGGFNAARVGIIFRSATYADHDFSFWGDFRKMRNQFAQRAAKRLLVQFADFSRDTCFPFATTCVSKLLKGFQQAKWAFIYDKRIFQFA